MVRKSRIAIPGIKFHIITRGVRRSNLFYEDEDYLKYLVLIQDAIHRYSFKLHTYCLMSNHIHLQLETSNISTAVIMQYINTKYARYFNRKYEFTGHVFEKRYIAEHIDSADYELDVSRYIHLNPKAARMVEKLEDYRWSSYPVYAELVTSSFVYTEQILSYFPTPLYDSYETFIKTPYQSCDYSEFLQREGL